MQRRTLRGNRESLGAPWESQGRIGKSKEASQ